MRLCLTTIGSDGDVQPYLALAVRLRAAGHAVRFAAVRRYAARVTSFGIPFVEVGRGWNDDVMAERFAEVLATRNPLTQLERVVGAVRQELVEMVPELIAVTADVDGVISHPFNLAGVVAAQVSHKPLVCGHLSPNLLRSQRLNPTGGNLGVIGNAMIYRLVRAMTRRATDHLLADVFAAAQLPAARDILFDATPAAARLNLLAVSPSVIAADPWWDGRYQQVGYWFLDEPTWQPPAPLVEAMAGVPPVVITFGSMAGVDASVVTAIVAETAHGLSRRVILQGGWAGLGAGPLPQNVLKVGFVPHDWLFTHAACVVHHGGAGTTAATLRAGLPSIVVWHMGDQPAWGKIIQRLGAGPAPLSHATLRAATLRRRIDAVLADDGMRRRAGEIGARIRGEDGVGRAVEHIERALG